MPGQKSENNESGRAGQIQKVDVIKLSPELEEKWRYQAKVVQRKEDHIIIEAHFDRSEVQVGDLRLSPGDRFLEIYFRDRWYNIFEVYAGNSNQLKGWYCNISQPAVFSDDSIRYIDLALDLVILPQGLQETLDKDEFALLELDEDKKKKALAALSELQTLFAEEPLLFRISKYFS